MNRLYALALLALVASVLLAPAALAQPALPSRADAVLAGKRAHAERLARAFPSPALPAHAEALASAADTYVLTERTAYTADLEGFFQPTEQVRLTYEGAFRQSETVYDAVGGEFVPARRVLYEYSYPLLLRRTEEVWDGEAEAFVPTEREIHTYGGSQGSGLPTATLYQEFDGTDFRNVERVFYTVGGTGIGGHYTLGEWEVWTGAGWQATEQFSFTQEGADVVYTEQALSGSAWVNTERTIYPGTTLDALQDRFRELLSELDDLNGAFAALRLPDSIFQEWEGDAWVNVSRQRTETFSVGGIYVHVIGDTWDTEAQAWLPESLLEIGYEPHAEGPRPVYAQLELWDEEEEWVPLLVEEYEHALVSGRINTITRGVLDDGEMIPLARHELTWQLAGTTDVDPDPVAGRLALDAPYPNPAATAATITYRLEAPGHVAVRLYDALGRRVATLFEGEQAAGAHPVALDATALPSGLYLVRLEAPGVQQTRPLTVVR